MDSNKRFLLEDKLIVITGASSGIGRETAILCSELGARVSIIARNQERLQSTFNNLKGEGHSFISLDVSRHSEISDCVDKIVSSSGKIDGFVHSAGICKTLPLRMNKPEDLLEMLSVNLVSSFEFIRMFSKKKFSNDSASFVLISSIRGVVGEIGLSSYCASKGAMISGTKALSLELAARKQRINCISPAMIKTEMMDREFSNLSQEAVSVIEGKHPLGFGTPEDVANAVAFLLSDSSKWITGSNLVLDGGYSAT
jgi:NAD(P)-dependent dehydrogenase (short-subunit alcohol dehydrogenase family)